MLASLYHLMFSLLGEVLVRVKTWGCGLSERGVLRMQSPPNGSERRRIDVTPQGIKRMNFSRRLSYGKLL